MDDRRTLLTIGAAAVATFVAVFALTPGPAARTPRWNGPRLTFEDPQQKRAREQLRADMQNAINEAPPAPLESAEDAEIYYANCDAARAAGAAPLYAGDGGYRAELDRDRDGAACEPYPGA